MTMEVSEELFGEAVKYATVATRSPNKEEILAAKHLLRKPEVRHLGCEVPTVDDVLSGKVKLPYFHNGKAKILSEEEVKVIFSMEGYDNAVDKK